MQEEMTIEQIRGTIKAARDSVHVINEVLEQLAAAKPANKERKGNLQRNVGHLKIIVAKQEIIDSGEDIQDLHTAIAAGEAKLAEEIWATE
jgi:hypothetical protein